MSAGRKSAFSFEIDGSKAAAYWNQEQPDCLWVGHRDRPNEFLLAHPSLLQKKESGAIYGGNEYERWPDAQKNLIHNFYGAILEGKAQLLATFADGYRTMQVVEAALASHQKRSWQEIGSIKL